MVFLVYRRLGDYTSIFQTEVIAAFRRYNLHRKAILTDNKAAFKYSQFQLAMALPKEANRLNKQSNDLLGTHKS